MSGPVLERTGLYGASADEAGQRRAFTSGAVPVAVYGLGKMGLPLAAVYADVTGRTIGVDIDEAVVRAVNEGKSPIEREPGLQELVTETVESGGLRATTDGTAAAEEAAVHVLMVPTLLTSASEPDLSMLEAAVSTVGTGLSAGDLVIVESTVPPRTTHDAVRPQLAEESGIDQEHFGVAACPERTVSGQALADIRGTHPKVVGGVDDESTRVASLIYGEITDNDIIETTDATTAEATKVFEGVYRDVNIALANELALFAREMDIDVNEAIETANTIPVCDIHDPGPGVGGHCIPVYPYFLSGRFDADAALLRTARERNDGMPAYTAWMCRAILAHEGIDSSAPNILLLGMTYKANVAELRNSPSIALTEHLTDDGASVHAVDPLVDSWSEFPDVQPVSLADAREMDIDLLIVATLHDEFADLAWEEFDAPILDGRAVIDQELTDAHVYTIGGRWP